MKEKPDFLSAPWIRGQFAPAAKAAPYDFVDRSGRTIVDVVNRPFAVRDLLSGILRLAAATAGLPKVKRAGLILIDPRPSWPHLRDEWRRVQAALAPDVARRLTLVAVGRGHVSVEPEQPYFRDVATHLMPLAGREPPRVPGERPAAVTPTRHFAEVVKVLVLRWLKRQGPIAIGALARQVGCSYPTAAKVLSRLERDRALSRSSNRAVELSRFPDQAWREVLVMADALRRPRRYGDASGRPMAPEAMLRKLARLAPAGVAVGGVSAARRWHPQFDLNGTPRIDLVQHVPPGNADGADFVARLDPALVSVDRDAPASLVVHRLVRADPLFAADAGGTPPWADPVETALDLYDLRLDAQANALLAHFRPEVRLA